MRFIQDGRYAAGKHTGVALDEVSRCDRAFTYWVLASWLSLDLSDFDLEALERSLVVPTIPNLAAPPLPPTLPADFLAVPPLPVEPASPPAIPAEPSLPAEVPPEALRHTVPNWLDELTSEEIEDLGRGTPHDASGDAQADFAEPNCIQAASEDPLIDGDDGFEELPPPEFVADDPNEEEFDYDGGSAEDGFNSKIQWTPEQHKALADIDAWYRSDSMFYALIGPAGSGKSTLVEAIAERYSCVPTAMTGKAALRLAEVTGRGASTLHAALYFPPQPGADLMFTRLRDRPYGIVIIDESSMVSPAVFADLKRWGARVLFVGDAYQLPPVITGKELEQHGEDYSVFREVEGTSLETVMRNAGGVLRAATKVRETGEIYRQSDLDDAGGYVFERCRSPMERAVDLYCAEPKDHLLVTWRNAARMSASRLIRERLGHDGPLPDDGEPVLIKKNGQDLLNGEIVTCGGFEDGPMIADLQCCWMWIGTGAERRRVLVTVQGGSESKGGEFFDGHPPWIEDWRRYHAALKRQMLPEPLPVTWGYCLTAHGVQGSQADQTTVFLDRGDERNQHFRKSTTLPSGETVSFGARFVYTAITRAKRKTTMLVGR